jgi:hypothetical protein
MGWANSSNVSTTNLSTGTSNPALARTDIKNAFDELVLVIDGLGTLNGAVKLESDGKIFANTGIKTGAQDLNLEPGSQMVKFNNFLNLNPVAYANLPTSPAKGDIAFLTTDGAGDTQDQPIYYNGSAWKYFNNQTDGGTDATVDAS